MAKKKTKEEIYRSMYLNPVAYMSIGDLDKSFHRPECGCTRCEKWRKDNHRPTHKELKDLHGDLDWDYLVTGKKKEGR